MEQNASKCKPAQAPPLHQPILRFVAFEEMFNQAPLHILWRPPWQDLHCGALAAIASSPRPTSDESLLHNTHPCTDECRRTQCTLYKTNLMIQRPHDNPPAVTSTCASCSPSNPSPRQSPPRPGADIPTQWAGWAPATMTHPFTKRASPIHTTPATTTVKQMKCRGLYPEKTITSPHATSVTVTVFHSIQIRQCHFLNNEH